MSEFECRYDGCDRLLDSKQGRNSHEGLGHSEKPHPEMPDEESLRDLYEEHASMSTIADKFGVSRPTVSKWISDAGIESNSRDYYWKQKAPNVFTDRKGYERVIVMEDGANSSIRIHQLLAIAQGKDPHDVFSSNTEVHHKSGVEWDNRWGNVELLEKSEHRKLHLLRSPRSPLVQD